LGFLGQEIERRVDTRSMCCVRQFWVANKIAVDTGEKARGQHQSVGSAEPSAVFRETRS